MSLDHIVKALGGELYDGGSRANIPAPGHSAADRSVSLLLKEGRVFVHTFSSQTDWRDVFDHLRQRGLIDEEKRPTGRGSAGGVAGSRRGRDAPASNTVRLAAARRIWDEGRPIRGTLAERNCRLRHVKRSLPDASVARFCSATPVAAYHGARHTRPALLMALQDGGGGFTAVEITYLAANGLRARTLKLSRKTVGPVPPNSAIRLDPAAPEMLVAEGVFTTLSATERFSLPSWALMSTRNLRTWIAPEGVRAVLIAADRGRDGEASAEILAGRLRTQGVRVRIEPPPAPHGDWNDWAQAGGIEGSAG
jgi:hypothetical protein